MKTWVKWKLEKEREGDFMDEDRNFQVGKRDAEGVHSIWLTL